MEPIAPKRQPLRERMGERIASGHRRQALVKRRVKDRNRGDAGQEVHSQFHHRDFRGVVQGIERTEISQAVQNTLSDACRGDKAWATVHHPMADGIYAQRLAVRKDLLCGLWPQALLVSLNQDGFGGHGKECVLQARAADIERQDIHCGKFHCQLRISGMSSPNW